MLLLTAIGASAYPLNRALSFTPEGYVVCGQMPNLNNLGSYSLQFWINPSQWSEKASILSRGEKFKVELDNSGNIIFNVDNSKLEVSSSDLALNTWNQITLICKNGNTVCLVNGTEVKAGSLAAIPEEESELVIGGGFEGLIDEIRIFDEALNDEMKTFDYFINNTINKWNPMWENLLAYYKIDQEDCPYIVDYKSLENLDNEYDNHGIISEKGVTKVLANNDNLPYLVNAAYTENSRFFDRIIPRDQYLLSNEIIILGADCIAETGHLRVRTPNNHATAEGGVTYLSSFEGREGVLSLDGNAGSRLVAPSGVLQNLTTYMFETWLYLEEWTPGAYLVRNENETQDQGLAIFLGQQAESPRLVVRVDGQKITSNEITNLPLKQWVHIGINSTNGGAKSSAFSFYIDGKSYNGDRLESDGSNVVPSNTDVLPFYIGESLNGKLDETCFWNKTWTINDEKNHQTSIPLPSLDKNVLVADMEKVGLYYRYDDPDNLGFSSHSQDNWANIMRKAYEGYTPGHITLSVRGHGSADNPGVFDEFNKIMNDPEKRKIFAQDLAEASKNYDGVELDFEWVYNATGWSNYNQLSKAIIEALPAGKTFRISTHNVTYEYPKGSEGIENPGITGFTFQQYGPQKVHFNYVDGFTKYVNSFLNYGYPADKIMTSYSTTTSKSESGGDITGLQLKNILATYEPSDANIDSFTSNGDTWYYMGPIQVYKRAKYTREKNLQGIFYWDMGNDYWEGNAANPIMPKYNNAKYCSYGLNSNIHPKVGSDLKVNHYGEAGIEVIETENATSGIIVYPSPAEMEINVTVKGGQTPVEVLIFSLDGKKLQERYNTSKLVIGNLSSGIYIVSAKSQDGKTYKTKFIKR